MLRSLYLATLVDPAARAHRQARAAARRGAPRRRARRPRAREAGPRCSSSSPPGSPSPARRWRSSFPASRSRATGVPARMRFLGLPRWAVALALGGIVAARRRRARPRARADRCPSRAARHRLSRRAPGHHRRPCARHRRRALRRALAPQRRRRARRKRACVEPQAASKSPIRPSCGRARCLPPYRNPRETRMTPNSRNFWIGVVSKDHVDIGVAGGFTQVNHGKAGPLERMRAGDGFAFYSPRTRYPDGELVAGVHGHRPHPQRHGLPGQRSSDSFRPFRLDVDYFPAQPAPVRPLIDELSFIRSKAHWGAAFRFGVLRVPEADFALIAARDGPLVRTTDFAHASRRTHSRNSSTCEPTALCSARWIPRRTSPTSELAPKVRWQWSRFADLAPARALRGARRTPTGVRRRAALRIPGCRRP